MPRDVTFIARHSTVCGRIETDNDLHIDGRIEGTIRSGGRVTIAATAVAIAEIHSACTRVEGVVVGNVVATDRIEVASGARVAGDLRAPAIDLAALATFDGRIDRRAPELELDRPEPARDTGLGAKIPVRRAQVQAQAPSPPRLARRTRLVPRQGSEP